MFQQLLPWLAGLVVTPALTAAVTKYYFDKALERERHGLNTVLETQRHQFSTLLEKQRADLNVLVGRQARIDAKEFEVLADLWSRYVAASYRLAHMAALSVLWKQERFRTQERWNEIIKASEITSEAVHEAEQQLMLVDIFLPENLARELGELSQMIRDAASKLSDACNMIDIEDQGFVPHPYSPEEMTQAEESVSATMAKRLALREQLGGYLRQPQGKAIAQLSHRDDIELTGSEISQ